MEPTAIWSGWRAALAGMASPLVIATALVLTTLLVEDLAIAAGAALAYQGLLSWELAFAAVAGGIALGDLGLYAMGRGALRLPWLARRAHGLRAAWAKAQVERQLVSAVLLARVIPGLRLATYTACGVLRVPLLPFAAWVAAAVVLWTAGLFAISVTVGPRLAERLGVPHTVAVALPIVALAVLVPLAWRLFTPRHHPITPSTRTPDER
jgi:membrane protein DedA with SNARE-associated domain